MKGVSTFGVTPAALFMKQKRKNLKRRNKVISSYYIHNHLSPKD